MRAREARRARAAPGDQWVMAAAAELWCVRTLSGVNVRSAKPAPSPASSRHRVRVRTGVRWDCRASLRPRSHSRAGVPNLRGTSAFRSARSMRIVRVDRHANRTIPIPTTTLGPRPTIADNSVRAMAIARTWWKGRSTSSVRSRVAAAFPTTIRSARTCTYHRAISVESEPSSHSRCNAAFRGST